jgi:hypothetical protein
MATKFFVCFSILIILSAGQSMEVRVSLACLLAWWLACWLAGFVCVF